VGGPPIVKIGGPFILQFSHLKVLRLPFPEYAIYAPVEATHIFVISRKAFPIHKNVFSCKSSNKPEKQGCIDCRSIQGNWQGQGLLFAQADRNLLTNYYRKRESASEVICGGDKRGYCLSDYSVWKTTDNGANWPDPYNLIG
jgi:hypothetical protein